MANINDLLTTLAKRLRPLMVAVSEATLTAGEGPGIDIADNKVGLGGDAILLYKSNGDPVAEFAATEAGLTAALAAAASGNVVLLPAVTIAGNHSVPAGVTLLGISPESCILTGTLTLGEGAALMDIAVAPTATDGNPLVGVAAPSSGEARIYNCRIAPVNNGAGGVHAVHVSSSGDLVCHNCYLDGSGALGGGSGYAGYRDPESAGNLKIIGGTALGSNADDPFNE